MKISELYQKLHDFQIEHGDVDVRSYNPFNYLGNDLRDPVLVKIINKGEQIKFLEIS